MGGFRRFVIGMTEFFQWISIIIVTFASAIVGKTYSTLAWPNAGTVRFADQSIGSISEIAGMIIGGIVGFVVSGTVAAFLFILIEIAANTRQTAIAQNDQRYPEYVDHHR